MASRFECSFCLDRFVDPRFLPCPGHHTFCRGCIENYLIRTVQSTRPGTEFKCPNCRSMVKLPKDGIAGLTVNYYLDETKEKAPKPRYNTCKKHREEDLRFYCIKCKEVICRDCKVVSHEGHKIEMVADVIAKLKENIETFLDVATIDLNARERDLRVSVDSKIKDYQESLGSVEPAVKILKTELNGVFEAFTNSTKPGYEKAKENLNTIINWAAKSRQRISFYREKLNQECRQTSFETVKVLEEYRDSFQDIYEKNAPPKIDMFVRSSCFVESEVSKLSEKVLVAAKDFKRSMSNHFRR